VVERAYVPDAGDLVWLTFDPQAGPNGAGGARRSFCRHGPTRRRRLALACPVTTHEKGYPFEVPLPSGGPIHGAVLADHVKHLDWDARRVRFEGKAPVEVLTHVRERLRVLLGL
jgi:mRNA interferase MazF